MPMPELNWTAFIKIQHKTSFQSNTVGKKITYRLLALVGPYLENCVLCLEYGGLKTSRTVCLNTDKYI